MTAPDAPIVGYRVWRDAGDRLLPLNLLGEAWTPGPMTARCHHGGHVFPRGDCTCGLYAWHGPPVDPGPGWVLGAVLGWGRVEVHYDGFRAEHAQVVALAARDERAAVLARHFDARVVPADGLEACAQELGTRPAPTAFACTAEQLLTTVTWSAHAALCLLPTTSDQDALLTLTAAVLDLGPCDCEDVDRRLRHALRAAAAVVRAPATGQTFAAAGATARALETTGSPAGWSDCFDLDVVASAPFTAAAPAVLTPRAAALRLADVLAEVCEEDGESAAGPLTGTARWFARRRPGLPPGPRPPKGKDTWKPVPRQDLPDDAPPSQRLYAARGLLPDREAALAMANDACRDAPAWPPAERAKTWSELTATGGFSHDVELDLVQAAVHDPAIWPDDRLRLLAQPGRRVDPALARQIWHAPIDPVTAWIVLRGCGRPVLRLAWDALCVEPDASSSDLARAAGALLSLGSSSWFGLWAARGFAADPAYPLMLRGVAVGTHPRALTEVPPDDPDLPRLRACPGRGFMGGQLDASPQRIAAMLWAPLE